MRAFYRVAQPDEKPVARFAHDHFFWLALLFWVAQPDEKPVARFAHDHFFWLALLMLRVKACARPKRC